VLVAPLAAGLAVEPASRSAGKLPCCLSKSPRLKAGGFFWCAEHVRRLAVLRLVESGKLGLRESARGKGFQFGAARLEVSAERRSLWSAA
jgi:hypothetical protein